MIPARAYKFVSRIIVILSEAKDLRLFLSEIQNQWPEMFRFAQHDR